MSSEYAKSIMAFMNSAAVQEKVKLWTSNTVGAFGTNAEYRITPKTDRVHTLPEQRKEVIDLYQSGHTIIEVSLKTGISVACITGILKRAKVHIPYRHKLKKN